MALRKKKIEKVIVGTTTYTPIGYSNAVLQSPDWENVKDPINRYKR